MWAGPGQSQTPNPRGRGSGDLSADGPRPPWLLNLWLLSCCATGVGPLNSGPVSNRNTLTEIATKKENKPCSLRCLERDSCNFVMLEWEKREKVPLNCRFHVPKPGCICLVATGIEIRVGNCSGC